MITHARAHTRTHAHTHRGRERDRREQHVSIGILSYVSPRNVRQVCILETNRAVFYAVLGSGQGFSVRAGL